MIGSLILSHDSFVVRFGSGVDTQFSHGSGTSTERVKMTKFYSNIHPFSGFKLTVLCCTLSIQIKERTVKMSKMFGESSHLLNFALSYLLENT